MSSRYLAYYVSSGQPGVATPNPVVITLSVAAPTAIVRVHPDPVVVSLSVATPTARSFQKANPSPVVISLSVEDPVTVVRANPSPVVISLSIPAPTTGDVQQVFPNPVVITLSVDAPVTRVAAKPSPVVLSLSLPAPSLNGLQTVSPSPVVVTCTVQSPVVSYLALQTVTPTPLVISLSVVQPSVIGGYRSTVLAPLAINLSIASPAVVASPPGVTLNGQTFDDFVKQVRYEVVLTGHHASLPDVLIPASGITIQRYVTEIADPVVVPATSETGPLTRPLGGYATTDNLGDLWTNKELYDLDHESFSFRDVAISPVNPDLMFMGSDNRMVKRSTDGGRTWENISLPETASNFLGVQYVLCDPHNLNNVLAYVAGEGFYRSTDQGQTFIALPQVGSGIISPNNLLSFVSYHPVSANTVYSLVNAAGIGYVFRSTDQGQTWSTLHTFDLLNSYGAVRSLHFTADPDVFFLTTFLDDLIFKTTDGGFTWASSNSGINMSPIPTCLASAMSPSDPDTMYLLLTRVNPSPVFSFWEIYRTVDGGANWTKVQEDLGGQLYTPRLVVSPADPDIVVLVARPAHTNDTFKGVAVSLDGGATFDDKNVGLPYAGNIAHKVLFNPDGSRLHLIQQRYITAFTYGYQVIDTLPRLKGTSRADVSIPAPPATMQAIADRAVVVDGQKAQLIIREVKERPDGVLRYYTLTRGNLINLRINQSPRKKDVVLSLEEEAAQRPVTSDPKTISLGKVIGIDSQESIAVSLSGLITDYELYDRVIVDGQEFTVTTIQHRLTPKGRYTDLSNNSRSVGNQGDIGTFVNSLEELGPGVQTRGTFSGSVFSGTGYRHG